MSTHPVGRILQNDAGAGAWDSGVKLTALVARNARMKCLGATDQSTAAVLIGKRPDLRIAYGNNP
jgi:hypothetical protein